VLCSWCRCGRALWQGAFCSPTVLSKDAQEVNVTTHTLSVSSCLTKLTRRSPKAVGIVTIPKLLEGSRRVVEVLRESGGECRRSTVDAVEKCVLLRTARLLLGDGRAHLEAFTNSSAPVENALCLY